MSIDAKLPVVMRNPQAGSTAADYLFDGGSIADKGVMYVSYNYRTNYFGLFATLEASLNTADPHPTLPSLTTQGTAKINSKVSQRMTIY
jgi:hypothetical protein